MRLFVRLLVVVCGLGWLHATPAEQAARWQHGRTDPHRSIELDKILSQHWLPNRALFTQIERMVPNGVPAAVVLGLLEREQSGSLRLNPAQGDPLTHRSIHVPRGRIPGKNPPYTFMEAAADAYYSPELDHLQSRNWRDSGALLDAVENFNGGGYRRLGLASPYVWSGVVGDPRYRFYVMGKFVADGKFSRTFKDPQPGVAAILMRMRERGMEGLPAALLSSSAERPAALGAAKAADGGRVATKSDGHGEPWHGPNPSQFAKVQMRELGEADPAEPSPQLPAAPAASQPPAPITWLRDFLRGFLFQ